MAHPYICVSFLTPGHKFLCANAKLRKNIAGFFFFANAFQEYNFLISDLVMNVLTVSSFPKIEIYPKEYWSFLKAFCSFSITCDKLSVYHNVKKKRILQKGEKKKSQPNPTTKNTPKSRTIK